MEMHSNSICKHHCDYGVSCLLCLYIKYTMFRWVQAPDPDMFKLKKCYYKNLLCASNIANHRVFIMHIINDGVIVSFSPIAISLSPEKKKTI